MNSTRRRQEQRGIWLEGTSGVICAVRDRITASSYLRNGFPESTFVQQKVDTVEAPYFPPGNMYATGPPSMKVGASEARNRHATG
ncbi:hypothetical protein GWI33_007568 [Rhynchophorus ferrugineus]|uniref:Uncharacterized protein n=1 Tax=Rhynchophorus ferrugineus TaxID=354439 RepID=A0A834IHK3_RHYFE|nr:hypothetical protein GWI33_007568 [Rhynchophorus ferrugineus]